MNLLAASADDHVPLATGVGERTIQFADRVDLRSIDCADNIACLEALLRGDRIARREHHDTACRQIELQLCVHCG